MKSYLHHLLVIGFTLSIAMTSFGQADTTIVNKTWANWILASIDYAEENYTIMPKQFTSVLFAQYSITNVNENESFNSSVFKFLEANYGDKLKHGKLYFVQRYFPTACGFYNNAKYSVVLDSIHSFEIFKQSGEDYNWEIGKDASSDFKGFETKFEEYTNFENLSRVDGLLPYYYIITEFDKGNVRVKTLFARL